MNISIESLRVSSEYSKAGHLNGKALELLIEAGFTIAADLIPKKDFVPGMSIADETLIAALNFLENILKFHDCIANEVRNNEDSRKSCEKKLQTYIQDSLRQNYQLNISHGIRIQSPQKLFVETDITIMIADCYHILIEVKLDDDDITRSIRSGALAQLSMDYFKGLKLGAAYATTVFGIVTNGIYWQFVKFSGRTIQYSKTFHLRYYHGSPSLYGNNQSTISHLDAITVGLFLCEILNGINKFKVLETRVPINLNCTYESGIITSILHGKCTVTFSNGTYEGEFMSGQKHGTGKFTFRDGSSYEGSWYYNLMQGFGVLTYPNGDTYSGYFMNGLKHGWGKYTSGCCYYSGYWADDNFTQQVLWSF